MYLDLQTRAALCTGRIPEHILQNPHLLYRLPNVFRIFNSPFFDLEKSEKFLEALVNLKAARNGITQESEAYWKDVLMQLLQEELDTQSSKLRIAERETPSGTD